MSYNNYVQQTDNNTMIAMNDWRIGLWITETGALEIYIDNDNGSVIQHHISPEAEDDNQWAGTFIYGVSGDDFIQEVFNDRRNRHSYNVRGNVRVEVTQ
jgi:hypothetical protein